MPYCASRWNSHSHEERPQRVDEYGNWLHLDGTWGGGPFQNGTSNLLQFWLPQGFRKRIGLIDVNSINPIHGRVLRDCPDRAYYVHAARRLANLVKTIREQHENEPINIVSHSQGTMIALCSLFYTKQMGVRGPDTVILNSSPYRFDTHITDFPTAAEGDRDVQSERARIETFAAAAKILQSAKDDYSPPNHPARAECTYQHQPRHPSTTN